MIDQQQQRARAGQEVTEWYLAFFPAQRKLWKWWIPGKYKHVSALGYSPTCGTWIIFDFALMGGSVWLLPGNDDGVAAIDEWAYRAVVVKCHTPPFTGRKFLFGLACVPAMQHLTNIGVRAFTPTGLLRRLIRSGAEIMHGATITNEATRG